MAMIKSTNTLLNTEVSYDSYSENPQDSVFMESKVMNHGFVTIEEKLFQNGWVLIQNEMNFISYCKGNYYIEITVEESGRIYVSVPLGKSKYQYLSSCKNYIDACSYILLHV